MRARLNIAAIFLAVGLGALTVILPYDAGVLIPRRPYYHWIFAVASLAALAMLLVLGLGDDPEELEETAASGGHFLHWRAVGLAFLAGAVATAAFIGATALVTYLDRTAA